MALKFIDGFEQYVNATDLNTGSQIYQLSSHSSSIGVNYRWYSCYEGSAYSSIQALTSKYRTAQTNAASLSVNGSTSLFMFFPSNTTLVMGFGFRVDAISSRSILVFYNSATDQNTGSGLHFYLDYNGTIRAYNESTNATIASSSSGVVASYTWVYLEFKISFGASGSIEVRANGDTIMSATGVNTLCGLTSVSGINFCNNASTADYNYYDDLYICDTSGTANNDFLGPISVYTLFPNANGTTNDFTAIGGAGSNYQSVNTEAPNTATYVESSVTGAKELYQVSDLPITSGTVYGVLVRSLSKKQDSGSRSQQLLIRTSGTEANSASLAATQGTWANMWAIFEKQADGTTAWDITAVNAMEIGHKNT